MALCSEDLSRDATVLRFPGERARTRAVARRHTVARRRIALGGVAAMVGVATLFGGGTGVASRPGAPRAVVVRAGDTLWDVARAHAPGGIDTRAYVDALIEINDLEGALQAGMRLRLPR
jgi:hypothetical protein